MTSAGNFPKVDGDIYYSQDVNEAGAWAFKVLTNVLRSTLLIAGSTQQPRFFSNSFYYNKLMYGSWNVDKNSAETSSWRSNYYSGLVPYYFTGSVASGAIIAFATTYDAFSGTILTDKWTSGVFPSASGTLNVADTKVSMSSSTNGYGSVIFISSGLNGCDAKAASGATFVFHADFDGGGAVPGEAKIFIGPNLHSGTILTSGNDAVYEIRCDFNNNYAYTRVYNLAEQWHDHGSQFIGSWDNWYLGFKTSNANACTVEKVGFLSGNATAVGSYISEKYFNVSQPGVPLVPNNVLVDFDIETQGGSPILAVTADSGTNWTNISGNGYPTSIINTGSWMGAKVLMTTIAGSIAYLKQWQMWGEG